jgi:hypothetical protein
VAEKTWALAAKASIADQANAMAAMK